MSSLTEPQALRPPQRFSCRYTRGLLTAVLCVFTTFSVSVLANQTVQGQTQSNIQLPFQIGRSISILASLNGSPNQPLCFDTGLGGELVISSNLAYGDYSQVC